jgi:hypothetical protein
MRKIWIASALALSLGVGALGALPAQASSKGRRNTAIGLGAAAAYELLRGKGTTGLVLGAGAAYGYKQYKDKKDEERRDYRYSDRYYGSRSSRRSRPARHDEYRTYPSSRYDDGQGQYGRHDERDDCD